MRVSIKRLIWATETPNIDGPMSASMRRTPGSSVRIRGTGKNPSRKTNGN